MKNKTVALFGEWNDTTPNVEVSLSLPDGQYLGAICISRPFSAKGHTLSFAQARILAHTILELLEGK